MRKRYLLLVRHASRNKGWKQPDKDQTITGWADRKYGREGFDKPGVPLTRSLGGVLCDQLDFDNIDVTTIKHSEYVAAKQTADLFLEILKKRHRCDPLVQLEQCARLNPTSDHSSARDQLNAIVTTVETFGLSKADDEARDEAHDEAPDEAWLLVGHQPQLTQIARHLLDTSLRQKSRLWRWAIKLGRLVVRKPQLPADVLPLGSSEIACLELGERPQLLWLMTEKSPQLLLDLKAKIQSKYDVAKFFLGALVVGTGLTLSDSLWKLPHKPDKVVVGLGAIAALLSLGFTAATLFSYDRLLMPTEFWTGSSPGEKGPPAWTINRPPSQAQLLLFYEMIHIWTHFFIPAIVSAFASLALLTVAMAHNSLSELGAFFPGLPVALRVRRLIVLALVAALTFIVGLVAHYLWKPRLGFDD